MKPEETLRDYFRREFPQIFRKVSLQVRRTPRRLTGPFKTNRANRSKLPPDHPDFTAAEVMPRTEAKLLAQALEFGGAPAPSPELSAAAAAVSGRPLRPGGYRCPVTGDPLSFAALQNETEHPTHGRSHFHLGHVRPKAIGGINAPENTYWTSDTGNRIQGDRSLNDTKRLVIGMAEFYRAAEGVTWAEILNRYGC